MNMDQIAQLILAEKMREDVRPRIAPPSAGGSLWILPSAHCLLSGTTGSHASLL